MLELGYGELRGDWQQLSVAWPARIPAAAFAYVCVCRIIQGASWLLSVPGASSTVLEVVVPYSRGSLVDLLGEVSSSCLCVYHTITTFN